MVYGWWRPAVKLRRHEWVRSVLCQTAKNSALPEDGGQFIPEIWVTQSNVVVLDYDMKPGQNGQRALKTHDTLGLDLSGMNSTTPTGGRVGDVLCRALIACRIETRKCRSICPCVTASSRTQTYAKETPFRKWLAGSSGRHRAHE
jgi:hypothetical protein